MRKFQLYRCNHCGTMKALTSAEITDNIPAPRGFECDMILGRFSATTRCAGTLENITNEVLGQ